MLQKIKNLINPNNLILLNLVLQILDGLLTYIGVRLIGLEGEGNYLIKLIMTHFGVFQGLVLVKLSSIVILSMAFLSIPIVPKKVFMLLLPINIIYLFAVFTWIYILVFLQA